MSVRDEGVIKFQIKWQKAPALSEGTVWDLIAYRQKLFNQNLIGVYPDGIGFGNLSQRYKVKNQFIISGSQTGNISKVTADHFAIVTDYSIDQNWVHCSGPIQASSESLTHAMIYETFRKVNAIIHVHTPEYWKKLKNKVPTSSANVPYGTPQMALEIKRLAEKGDLKSPGVLVMAGHEDGIIAFGRDLGEAYQTLIAAFKLHGNKINPKH